MNIKKVLFSCLAFLFFHQVPAENIRTMTITNQCDHDVAWGIIGSVIQSKGENVTCSKEYSSCYDNKGFCGADGLCYYKYPDIVYGQDESPDFYIKPGVTKSYKIPLIEMVDSANNLLTQYRLSFGAQSKCTMQNGVYRCASGNCPRSNASAVNGQCQPGKSLYPPYTQASLTFNSGKNDYYNVNIINGVNVPISITPLGEFGNQDIQSQLFCKPTGTLPTGNPSNPLGCTWKFNPPQNEQIQSHIFTQIDRNIEADEVTYCQTSSECAPNQRCGLKYPEDLKTYALTGYCGEPMGYYTYSILCSLDGVSADLQTLLQCEHNKFDNSYAEQPIELPANASVEQRCPNSYSELSLKGVPNSARLFCNYELYQCATQSINVNGKTYKYLDSCYNYGPNDPESSACCGCVDWPEMPSNATNLCLSSPELPVPNPCSIDMGLSPPECRLKYETKVSAPNPRWLELVKPSLEWLIKGCPDALEYPHGGKHRTMQCSSKDVATEKNSNINYLVTFCPKGTNLFTDTLKPDAVLPSGVTDIANKDNKRVEDTGDVSKVYSMIIFAIFSILLIILLGFYARNRKDID